MNPSPGVRRAALVSLAMILVGCSAFRPSAQAEEPGSRLQDSQASTVPGEILVKFADEAARAVEQSRQVGTLPMIGIASLDALVARYGVTAMEPVFPSGRDPEAIKAKFPERTRRIPPGATVPELSGAYTVRFDPGRDIEEVVAAFAADPHVEFAQPNYVATHSSRGQMDP